MECCESQTASLLLWHALWGERSDWRAHCVAYCTFEGSLEKGKGEVVYTLLYYCTQDRREYWSIQVLAFSHGGGLIVSLFGIVVYIGDVCIYVNII